MLFTVQKSSHIAFCALGRDSDYHEEIDLQHCTELYVGFVDASERALQNTKAKIDKLFFIPSLVCVTKPCQGLEK